MTLRSLSQLLLGGALVVLATGCGDGTDLRKPFALITDGRRAIVGDVDDHGSRVLVRELDGTAFTKLATLPRVTFTPLATDGTALFAASGSPAQLVRIPLSGGAAEPLAPPDNVDRIAVVGPWLYWHPGGSTREIASGGAIRRMPLKGGAVEQVLSLPAEEVVIAFGSAGDSLLVGTAATGAQGHLRRLGTDGKLVDVAVTQTPDALIANAVEVGDHVVWTETDRGGFTSLNSLATGAASKPVEIGLGIDEASGLIVDGGDVLFVESTRGGVEKGTSDATVRRARGDGSSVTDVRAGFAFAVGLIEVGDRLAILSGSPPVLTVFSK